MKVWFVTFADGAAYSSTRLVAQARASGYFDAIRAYGPADFEPQFWRTHRAFLLGAKRGYGFWIWKYHFAARVLKEMRRGDVLVYMDSGSTLHCTPGARARFRDYLDLLRAEPSGLLRFSKWFVLKRRCKGDAFVYCDAHQAAIQNGSELLAGIFLLRKTRMSERYIGLLCEMIEQRQYYLFSNQPSRVAVSPHHRGNHSHDQALSSILARQCGCAVLANELEMASDDFPLRLSRHRR